MATIRDETVFASFAKNKENLFKIINLIPKTNQTDQLQHRVNEIYPVGVDVDGTDEGPSDAADGEDNCLVS